MFNSLGGESFTRKYIIWPWGQCHMNCFPVPSKSCDLYTYKVLSYYVQQFRKKIEHTLIDLKIHLWRHSIVETIHYFLEMAS